MREEREPRKPRPDREHPVGQALFNLSRDYWGPLFRAIDGKRSPEQIASKKADMLMEIAAVRGMVEAL